MLPLHRQKTKEKKNNYKEIQKMNYQELLSAYQTALTLVEKHKDYIDKNLSLKTEYDFIKEVYTHIKGIGEECMNKKEGTDYNKTLIEFYYRSLRYVLEAESKKKEPQFAPLKYVGNPEIVPEAKWRPIAERMGKEWYINHIKTYQEATGINPRDKFEGWDDLVNEKR